MSVLLTWYFALFTDKKIILVHSMGKSGSSSIYKSIRKLRGVHVLHTHFLSKSGYRDAFIQHKKYLFLTPPHLITSRFLIKFLPKIPKNRLFLICSYRDPISFTLSNLYQNPYFFKNIIPSLDRDFSSYKLTRDECDNLFSLKIGSVFYWNNWFYNELLSLFDIDKNILSDLNSSPYTIIDSNRARIGILKLNSLSTGFNDFLSRLLSVNLRIKLLNRNITSNTNKSYSTIVDSKLPEDIVNNILRNSLVNLLFTENEIQNIRTRYISSGL